MRKKSTAICLKPSALVVGGNFFIDNSYFICYSYISVLLRTLSIVRSICEIFEHDPEKDMMTITLNRTGTDELTKYERRQRNQESIATLKDFLRANYQPDPSLTVYINDETEYKVDTREFAIWMDLGKTMLRPITLTVVYLQKLPRHGYSLVYYIGENGSMMPGFAELYELGDMLTHLTVDEIKHEHGDDVVAQMARTASFLTEIEHLMS